MAKLCPRNLDRRCDPERLMDAILRPAPPRAVSSPSKPRVPQTEVWLPSAEYIAQSEARYTRNGGVIRNQAPVEAEPTQASPFLRGRVRR